MSIGNVVSISGGKDSTATLLLALERETSPLVAAFADTGHEHPQTYEYLDYLEEATGVPILRVRADFTQRMENKRKFIAERWPRDGVPDALVQDALDALVPTGIPMLDLCLWKGRFPSTRVRFCTQELKHEPITTQVMIPTAREHSLVLSWQGVRREESRDRARLYDFDTNGELPGMWNYRPILRWTHDEVFAFHRRHGVKWNPLYEQGMGRVGCMPCIHSRKNELREIARRFPEEIERVAHWERLVSRASKQGLTTWYDTRAHTQNEELSLATAESHGIMRAVKWSRTKHGGKELDPSAAEEMLEAEPPMCSSLYGLCE